MITAATVYLRYIVYGPVRPLIYPAMRPILVLTLFATTSVAFGEDFDPAEFEARRARLLETTGDGVTVILGNPSHYHATRFHQAPDFLYLTGISEPDGVLVMNGETKSSTVFVRQLSPFEAMWNGPGLLNDPGSSARYGIAIEPLEALEDHLREMLHNEDRLYLQLTPPDQLQLSRGEISHEIETRNQHPLFGAARNEFGVAIEKIVAFRPEAERVDVSPILDMMRWTKTPYEIERLREAGRIGAEGFVEAIRGTRPGVWEYELEAEARYVYQRNGAGDAFVPIVASGSNTLIIHYQDNDAQTKAGDVILMDYGAEVDGYTSDITRMWPVSGTFTEGQERMYRCVLEASKAIIAAIKPGVFESELQDIAEAVYERHGFGPQFQQFGRYIGHPVGLSVHDPDPGSGPAPDVPFLVGTVFNVEPLLSLPEEGVHMRLEDTILVTEYGYENLTAGVPIEIDEVYALIRDEKGTD